ncbi:MAG: aldo/keto reductase [Stappiaceae bacterium]
MIKASRIKLSKSAPEMSPIVWGSWRCLEQFGSATELSRFLGSLIELGVTSVDTADIYGGYQVQAFLGEAIKLLGDTAQQIEVITKCGVALKSHRDNRHKHYDSSPSYVERAVDESLRLLQLDRIDCFLLHRPDELMIADDTAHMIVTLIKSGKIRSFGVSNYRPDQVDLLASKLSTDIATNQVEFSALCPDAMDNGTLNQAQRVGFRPMAWSPLANGRLFRSEEPQAIRVRNALSAIASANGYANIADAALAFVMAHPSCPVPVLGTGRVDRIKSAMKSLDNPMQHQDWYAVLEACRGQPVP